MKNVAPGIYFALFGSFILTVALFQAVEHRKDQEKDVTLTIAHNAKVGTTPAAVSTGAENPPKEASPVAFTGSTHVKQTISKSGSRRVRKTKPLTKNAPTTASPPPHWSAGLSAKDIGLVQSALQNKHGDDQTIIYTAIQRNKEASRDIYPGEILSDSRIIGQLKSRMSKAELNHWTIAWSHLSPEDRKAIITVMRHDLAQKE